MRSTIRLSRTSIAITWVTSVIPASASAWGTVRGNPSNITPFFASDSRIRSLIKSIIIESGTSFPSSMYCFAAMPVSVPFFTAALNISPVET